MLRPRRLRRFQPGSVRVRPARGDTPGTGSVVFEHPLTSPGVVPTGFAAPGRGAVEQSAEGVILEVWGRCAEQAQTATQGASIRGLVLADGEVSLEFKVLSRRGKNRRFRRLRSPVCTEFLLIQRPAMSGVGTLARSSGGPIETLAQRKMISGKIVTPDDWNSMSVRLQGPNLWLVVNDQPVLSAVDSALEPAPSRSQHGGLVTSRTKLNRASSCVTCACRRSRAVTPLASRPIRGHSRRSDRRRPPYAGLTGRPAAARRACVASRSRA